MVTTWDSEIKMGPLVLSDHSTESMLLSIGSFRIFLEYCKGGALGPFVVDLLSANMHQSKSFTLESDLT